MARKQDPTYRTGQTDAKGRPICGAKNRKGQPCAQTILCQNGRCRVHGGTTPKGVASPHYQHGRYSKYLPSRLLARYEEQKADPELLSMRSDIALLDARLADLLRRVDDGGGGKFWQRLAGLRKEALIAARKGDRAAFTSTTEEILSAIDRGTADYAAWQDIMGLLDQRRRLVESEQRRLVAMQQMVTSEQAVLLIGAVLSSLKEKVAEYCDGPTGQSLLVAVSHDIAQLYGRPGVPGPGGDGHR